MNEEHQMLTASEQGRREGEWIQTFTGKQFWPLDPRPEDFDIQDIAHALSNVCRFTGHCTSFYSVAQHSVSVARSLPPKLQLQGLLHDGSEAYLCDVARPVKPLLRGYKAIERGVSLQLNRAFGLPDSLHELVKARDNAILADEAAALMNTPPAPWAFYAEPLGIDIDPLPPLAARSAFLQAFYTLRNGGVLTPNIQITSERYSR